MASIETVLFGHDPKSALTNLANHRVAAKLTSEHSMVQPAIRIHERWYLGVLTDVINAFDM